MPKSEPNTPGTYRVELSGLGNVTAVLKIRADSPEELEEKIKALNLKQLSWKLDSFYTESHPHIEWQQVE